MKQKKSAKGETKKSIFPLNIGSANGIVYIILAILCLTPYISAPIALFLGIIFALTFGTPFAKFNKFSSKYLLQVSVVGLGFGMNLFESLKSGSDGMIFTLFSVASVMFLGIVMGKWLRVGKVPAYLIASGTAICGGSAIAAVGPLAKAKSHEMSVALATIFVLNAVALFLFPVLGHWLGLTQHQFGVWAAIAIHDTSSVVGAGATYGEEALKVATTVKLTRALWIIPLSLFTAFYFRTKEDKLYIPWFIFFFILAMVANTYFHIPAAISAGIVGIARKALVLTLFFIGAGLSRETVKEVGVKPFILGISLWFFIAVISLGFIYFFY
ncbi:MAG: putative sulfate exporter family transporter [Paludibacter sp.]|nr:putative sulfate exporter family transporter [Paludibacter sp.]